jgi:maltose alpha-D-glucosyltransferase/alpha-amylase
MQLYGRGIRRRLAPMLDNDRRRLELAFSLLFSLPGTPMLLYGDEIGMGDDLGLPERECARTPMQWTAERHGGVSRAREVVRRVIDDDEYGFRKVNVADQRRDPHSRLNWTERMVRARRECPEISWGQFAVLPTGVVEVLAMRYDWRNTSLLAVQNFAARRRRVRIDVWKPDGKVLVMCSATATAGPVPLAPTSWTWRGTAIAGSGWARPIASWTGHRSSAWIRLCLCTPPISGGFAGG